MKSISFHQITKRRFSFLLCAFILFSGTVAFAQQNAIRFRILDEKTREPIRFCYLIIKGKNISSQSDENGFVKIRVGTADSLVVYQLGYFTKKTSLAETIANDNTILLKAKDIKLDEVVVTTREVDTLQNENTAFFLDFEFYDNFILALVNRGKKFNSLMLLDLNGNKISEKYLSIRCEDLFKDCFENIHVLTTDSIYQVYYNYQNLLLLKSYPIASYQNVLKPCECFLGTSYIFKVRHYKFLKNSYFMYEEGKPDSKHMIATVADSLAIRGFNQDFDISYFLEERNMGDSRYATSVTEITKYLDDYRENLVLSDRYRNLLRPVESEMKKVDTNFILVDYTHKMVHTFSLNGSLYKNAEVANLNGMTPKLCIDHDARTLIFSSLSSTGVLTLYRYDRIKNALTHKFEVSGFYFIRDFRIKENTLYFINKDRSQAMTKMKIIKAYIHWMPVYLENTTGK